MLILANFDGSAMIFVMNIIVKNVAKQTTIIIKRIHITRVCLI